MSSNDGEARIPLGIVLMSIGSIVGLTAVVIWFIMRQAAVQAAFVPPTRVPQIQVPTRSPFVEDVDEVDTAVALLPETPLEAETYPPHFVNALEAAQPKTGQPVRVVIPQINLDAPINPIGLQALEHEGSTVFQWQVPNDFIAGWHHSSAPLGTAGNTVLNGHHNIFGEIFRDLDELKEGDLIMLHDPEQTFTYAVTDILILEERGQPLAVRQENARLIADTDDERLTMVTCWPYSDNSHRLIVVAHPTGNPDS